MENNCILPHYAGVDVVSFGFYSILSEEEQARIGCAPFRNQIIVELIKSHFEVHTGKALLSLNLKLEQHFNEDELYMTIEDYALIAKFQYSFVNSGKTATMSEIELFMKQQQEAKNGIHHGYT